MVEIINYLKARYLSEKAQGICRAVFMAMLVLILIAFIVLLVKRKGRRSEARTQLWRSSLIL